MRRLSFVVTILGILCLAAGAALQAGTISGTVTDSTTGQPIAGVFVGIYETDCGYCSPPDSVGGGVTDSSGAYETSVLPAGIYVATTHTDDYSYASEMWDGFLCIPCNSAGGTPIQVTADGETTGIDFALEPAGSISGRVTDAATGLPLQDAAVDIWMPQLWVSGAGVDLLGDYTVRGLPAGSYYVLAWILGEHVSQAYDGVVCYRRNCPVGYPRQYFVGATPISVTAGNDTPGIDFALELGGTITGDLFYYSDSDPEWGPIPNGRVLLFSSEGEYLRSATTNETGWFWFWPFLPEGNYFMAAIPRGYIWELYDDIPCPGFCNPSQGGTPIPVTPGEWTSIAFWLEREEPFVEVAIDIKPGSYPNCFNSDGNGVIPVAILGSDSFDVTFVDTSSLAFDGAAVRIKGNGAPQCGLEDVTGDFSVPEGMPDGYLDLVCQFVDEGGFTSGEGEATVTGELLDGTVILGTDSICVVP